MSYRVTIRKFRKIPTTYPPYYKHVPGRIVIRTDWHDEASEACIEAARMINRKYNYGGATRDGALGPRTMVGFTDPLLAAEHSVELEHEGEPAEQLRIL